MSRQLKGLISLVAIVLGVLSIFICWKGALRSALAAEKLKETKIDKVRLVLQEGIQLIPVELLEKKGIAKKYQLQIERIMVTGPQGVYINMQTGDFDTAVGSWISTALLRAKGYKVTIAYSMHGYTNDVLVRLDSPIKSMTDLKGKNIGIFGGPFAGTTWVLRLEFVKFFGFDPVKESKVHYAAPPILMAMLEKGELDAILNLDPQAIRMLETGNFRSLGNMDEIWYKNTGYHPLHLVIIFNEVWAAKNPDVAKRFIAAYKEALEYMKSHSEFWPEVAKDLGIKTEKGIKLLQQRTINFFFIVKWDQKFIKEQYLLSDEIFKFFGEVEGFPKQIPEGTFTTVYTP